MPAEQVFKTLVVKGDRNGVCLAVIPGNTELDLKALSRLTGDRKTELAPLKDVQPLTGYIRGGVTALAGKKEYPVFIDETAILFDAISVSAGVRGTQIFLNPEDYIRIVRGTLWRNREAQIGPGRRPTSLRSRREFRQASRRVSQPEFRPVVHQRFRWHFPKRFLRQE